MKVKQQKKPLMNILRIIEHHESLQRMLQAQSKVKRINEARKDEELPTDKDAAVA